MPAAKHIIPVLIALLLLGNVFINLPQAHETSANHQDDPTLASLTPKELQWLKAHPVIKVAPDTDFPPIESLTRPDTFSGIAMDFLALLEKKLPVHFDIINLKQIIEYIF